MKYFTVDAFTEKPFFGNPAAIVPCNEVVSDLKMQCIATEMNISETAFVTMNPLEKDWSLCKSFKLRWFTPTKEVDFCGHATLATAHVIFKEFGNAAKELEFHTKKGILSARKVDDTIVIDLPAFHCRPLTDDQSQLFDKYVRAVAKFCKVDSVHIDRNTKKLLVRLDDSLGRLELESLVPDFTVLNTYDGLEFRGIIITVKGNPAKSVEYDFYSRYFAPWNGIPEDPVTGSAHSVLAPFWSKILQKNEMKCRQCSRRGGDLNVHYKDGRIDVTGPCVTVLEGHIRI